MASLPLFETSAAVPSSSLAPWHAQMWRNALHAAPSGITITSYNEWGEGTQSELRWAPRLLELCSPSCELCASRLTPCAPGRNGVDIERTLCVLRLVVCGGILWRGRGAGGAVEGAQPHTSSDGGAYADYSPDEPAFYMQRTKQWTSEAKRGCADMSRQQERMEL